MGGASGLEGVDKKGWGWVIEGSGAGRIWEGLMIWERVGMELGTGWSMWEGLGDVERAGWIWEGLRDVGEARGYGKGWVDVEGAG